MRDAMAADARPLVFRQVGTPAYQAAAEDAYEQARLRGYATGHATGMRDAAAETEDRAARAQAEQDSTRSAFAQQAGSAMVSLREAIARAHAAEARAARLDRAEVMRLAVELAEVVLGQELMNGDASARSVVARVLAEPDAADARHVRVSESDFDVIAKAGLLPEAPAFHADPTLAPGDAVVELKDGRIDMRIRHAIDRARELTAPHTGADSAI